MSLNRDCAVLEIFHLFIGNSNYGYFVFVFTAEPAWDQDVDEIVQNNPCGCPAEKLKKFDFLIRSKRLRSRLYGIYY